jgi:hypothetical protein
MGRPLPPLHYSQGAYRPRGSPQQQPADRHAAPLHRTADSNGRLKTETGRSARPPPPRTRFLCEVEMIEISRKIRVREVLAEHRRGMDDASYKTKPPDLRGRAGEDLRGGIIVRSVIIAYAPAQAA